MQPDGIKDLSLGRMLNAAAFLPMLALVFAIFAWHYRDHVAGRWVQNDHLDGVGWIWIPAVPEHEILFKFDEGRVFSSDSLTIDVRSDGSVSIDTVFDENPTNTDLNQLRSYLRANREAVNRHGGLFIRPAAESRYQRLIDVVSAVGDSGVEHYFLM